MERMARHRLRIDQAHLLVIDIQEKLLPLIDQKEQVVAQAERAVRAAAVLNLPITLSEQYVKGLGATIPALAEAAGGAPRAEKLAFSFCAEDACRERILSLRRPQVLLVGIEAHVCVQQPALDLGEMGLQPFVLADAVGSRRASDREVALERMRQGGVIVTTVESALFELLHASGTELFKRVLPLVK